MNEEMQHTLTCGLDNNLNVTAGNTNYGAGTYDLVYRGSAWDFWQDRWYPQQIIQSYPVYIQERAKDKGKQAFEIIKMLKDKKIINLKDVGDFVDAMDELIKIL